MSRLNYGTVSLTARLYPITVDTGGSARSIPTLSSLFSAVVVDIFEVEGVDMAWDVSEDREADVDKQISTASSNGPDANRRKEDGDEDDENSRNSPHFDSAENLLRQTMMTIGDDDGASIYVGVGSRWKL